jgi:pimeloyl-[acyl-carrier protein] methyl ester esterase
MNPSPAVILRHDQGSGRTLLFLHGWLMSGRVWGEQLPLAERFRVLTVDLPGHGESHWPGFSYDDCVRSLIELLDWLAIDKVCLIGWSMGAQLALQLYRQAPERLSGLVLVAGTPLFCMTDDFPHGLPRAEARNMELRIKRNLQKASGEFFSLMFSTGELPRGDLGRIAANLLARLPDLDIAAASLHELIQTDLRAVLPTIAIPTLIIHGSADKICLPGASHYMADKIPSAEILCFENVGHAPFISRAEQFNSAVAAFMERLP